MRLPAGRYARRLVKVVAPDQATIACTGSLPRGARCQVVGGHRVAVVGSRAVRRAGTYRLSVDVIDAEATVRRPLVVQVLKASAQASGPGRSRG